MQIQSTQLPEQAPLPVSQTGYQQVTGLQHRGDVRALTAEEIGFEIDMCVGCDRCMLACPVPMSAQITIAELNYATVSTQMTPQVAKFTDECVMCGSCVPVCPVANHRDLLMLSLKQRLGLSWNGPVDMSRVQQNVPIGWSLPQLVARLREQPLFRDPQLIPDPYLLHIIAASQLLMLTPGAVAMQEGLFGRDTYFILEGTFELSTIGPGWNPLPIALVNRGEYMGDHGMLTGQQHNATARAQGHAIVLMTPEQTMQRLMEIVPAIQQYIEQVNNPRSVEATLKRMPVFQGIAEADRIWLAGQAQVRKYDREERLFSEEGRARPARESLHFLLEGFVKVARRTTAGTGRDRSDERVIAYRQGGDYFAGGLDLLGDSRAVTVTAITRTRVAELPQQVLLQFFVRYPEVAQRFNQRLQQYTESIHTAQQTGVFAAIQGPGERGPYTSEARAGLHSLVSDGVVEGTEVLVIDLDKCIHCGECEAACTRRHGHSRMTRKGMVVGNISIVTACRQCQDPVCMLCSRAGIARMPGGEVYITENCIGCGICAERCPYDNISIVSLADAQNKSAAKSPWQRFNSLLTNGYGKERGYKLLPMASDTAATNSPDSPDSTASTQPKPLSLSTSGNGYNELLKKVAIKCDLCTGFDNQACIQACPTGAAFRVQPARFFGSTEDILARVP